MVGADRLAWHLIARYPDVFCGCEEMREYEEVLTKFFKRFLSNNGVDFALRSLRRESTQFPPKIDCMKCGEEFEIEEGDYYLECQKCRE